MPERLTVSLQGGHLHTHTLLYMYMMCSEEGSDADIVRHLAAPYPISKLLSCS